MAYQDGWSTPQPPPPSYYPVPQNNGLAVAALITGLLGFLCFVPGLVAVGLGIGGLAQSRRTGVGRGMSIAGICLGLFWCLVAVAILTVVVIAIPST